jgi:hypothetical protein
MSVLVDRTGKRCGKLLILSFKEGKGRGPGRIIGKWVCECECGNIEELTSWQLDRPITQACKECLGRERKTKQEAAAGRRRRADEERERLGDNYHLTWDYRKTRASFTQEQMARYEELMEGRSGMWNEREAVDVVMREPVPGICCERCLREDAAPPPDPRADGEDQHEWD